jgi:hypothetical protein
MPVEAIAETADALPTLLRNARRPTAEFHKDGSAGLCDGTIGEALSSPIFRSSEQDCQENF